MTLLAVLIISDKQIVRLVDIVIIISNKGKDLDMVLFDVLQMRENDEPQISPEVLKEKLDSILGDGQFVKENKPFKTTLNTLVGKRRTYRWNPLRLFNRAHIKARGNIYKHEVRPVSDSSTTVDHDDFDLDEILNLKDTTDTASV